MEKKSLIANRATAKKAIIATQAPASGDKLVSAKASSKLTGAKVAGARFMGAKVSGAKVAGAKFMGAKVSGAKVTGAKFMGAKVTGARVAPAKKIAD